MSRLPLYICTLLVCTGPVAGATITGTGSVTTVDGPITSIVLGDSMSFTVDVNEAAADTDVSDETGSYDGAVTTMSMTIGADTWSFSSGMVFTHLPASSVLIEPGFGNTVSGPSVDGLAPTFFSAATAAGASLTSDSLADSLAAFAGFPLDWGISFGTQAAVFGTAISQVPIPGGAVLFASALALIAGCNARLRRRSIAASASA